MIMSCKHLYTSPRQRCVNGHGREWCVDVLLQPWTERNWKSILILKGFIFVASLCQTNSIWQLMRGRITNRGHPAMRQSWCLFLMFAEQRGSGQTSLMRHFTVTERSRTSPGAVFDQVKALMFSSFNNCHLWPSAHLAPGKSMKTPQK